MTFKTFEDLLHTKYPEAGACPHGKFGGTSRTNQVEINFTPAGKCYCYYGSYQDILLRLGIKVVYQADIDRAKRHIARLKSEHGQPGLFGGIRDLSNEIQEWEEYLTKIESGEYIILD